MTTILIAYTTNAGSTGEVAETIGKTLTQDGARVDVRQIKAVRDVGGYDAVLVGGPMILGWHREAVQFVEMHQQTLSQKRVAYFLTALSLTTSPKTDVDTVPLYLDPALAKLAQNETRLTFRERFTTISHYLQSVLERAPLVKPISAAFFAGKLDYGALNLFGRLFVQVIIGAKEGDYRNWDTIRAWVDSVSPMLLGA
ncbi:MAG: flavodoxin domain-containing protein [Anaerolineae bacterium]|nr:flavodoxin domain-containing protein [Anaerolineae bacterium]